MPERDESKPLTNYIWVGAILVVVLGAIMLWLPVEPNAGDPAMYKLKIAAGFTVLALISLVGFAVVAYIATGKIDLSQLLNEPDQSKGASMSRFQLLIFTLVISLSLFLVVISTMTFPPIPNEVLTLLGISATTYGVSKGIQASRGSDGGNAAPPVQQPPAQQPLPPADGNPHV